MLGNITEKQPSRKVAPISVGNVGGFPPVLRTVAAKRSPNLEAAKQGSLGAYIKAVDKIQQPHHSASRKDVNNSTLSADESSETNASVIEAMSPDEITLALDEIRSLLSPKSIAFLQRGPVPIETGEATTKASRSSIVTLAPIGPIASIAPIAPTSENLWLGNSDRSCGDSILPHIESPTTDRYDLNGRKVVDPEQADNKIKDEVRKSGLFNASKIMTEEVENMVAALCVECMQPMAKARGQAQMQVSGQHQPVGFFLWRQDALASAHQQPQDELKHHQFESDSPGYTLREVIEMFRSEFAAQRIAAMRMLSGVLLRRECAVSLEAYSQTFASNREGSGSEAAQLRGIEDEVGRESALFSDLSVCFEALVARVASALSSSASGGELVLAGSSSAQSPAAALSQEHSRQLRKLLCWCCMHLLCASDLPVELPTLLLWALGSNINARGDGAILGEEDDLPLAPSFGQAAPRNNPAVAKLGLLRCLHMYLRSPAEEACVDWLRSGSMLWAAYGTPRLATPHTRRSGTSYEQDMAECAERSSKFLGEEDEEQEEDGDDQPQQTKQRTPDSVAEAFALQCRWSRISAIVSRSTVVATLTSHAITAVENLVSAAESSTPSSSSASSDIVTALGVSSLQLLALIARQGGDDALIILHKQFLRPSWRAFVTMCESDSASAGSALSEMGRRWWHVLAELILRDRSAAAFLFGTHGDWLGAMVLRLLLRKPSAPEVSDGIETIDVVVGRALQYALAYGYGFECVTELLMAEQVASSDTPLTGSRYPRFSIRFLAILEQAAVSAGALLNANVHASTCGVASQVPFVLPKAMSAAVQVGSSIFSFVKLNWNELQAAVLEGTQPVAWSTAVLALLSAVFTGAWPNEQPEAAAVPTLPEDLAATCQLRMAEAIVADGGLRGRGLIFSAVHFSAHVLAEEQKKNGGSVTAAVLHLSGQGKDLVRFAAMQELFNLAEVGRCVAACSAHAREGGGIGDTPGSTAWLQTQEYALSLYRLLNVAVGMSCGAMGESAALRSYADSAALCCGVLQLLPPPLKRSDDAKPIERLARGSVAEGILMWHGQRVQHAGIVAQATGLATLLLLFQNSRSAVAQALDSVLAVQLPKLTANSHCHLLVRFTRAYVRRLIFACHPIELSDPLAQYDDAEQHCAALAEFVVNKAFRCEVGGFDGAGGSSALHGMSPYSQAGDWMALRGPASSGVVLRVNWAFEVLLLLGDLGGDQLTDWLQVLIAHCRNQGQDESLLASQIYTLLKLSASDQAPKWTSAPLALTAPALPAAPDAVIGEVNERAVAAYRSLLTQLLLRVAHHAPTFSGEFCRVVSKEYFATTGVMSSHRHRMRAAKSGPSKYMNLEGVMDLCEKALDAGLSQAIDERVHAVALIALSGPLVPWSVRQRVWTQLAALRLVHLLEDRGTLQALLPVLVPGPVLCGEMSRDVGSTDVRGPASTESLSLYLEILDALCNLRSPSDRIWAIVSISIAQLAHFVFYETSVVRGHRAVTNAVTGQRALLLLHVLSLQEKGADAAWIGAALLSYAASNYARACGEPSSQHQENLVQHDEETGPTWTGYLAALPKAITVETGGGTLKEIGDLVNF